MRWISVLAFTGVLSAAETPAFYKDVLPILQQRCQECHRPGEAPPMSLLTYQDARPWARAIREAVASRKMPPWFADPHFGKFANDRSLSASEIATLTAWADGGAKPGDPKDAPADRQFVAGWTIGKPDLVLDLGVDHKIPAKGTVDYTYFLVPTGFTEDKWVESIEVLPGARAVVHHAVIYSRPKGSKVFGNLKPGEPRAESNQEPDQKHPPQSDKGTLYGVNNNSYEIVGVYVPGGIAYKTLPGQARLIPAGADLIFQMHYTTNGKEAVDRTRVGMVFAKQPPKERVINAFIMNETLHIPPGDGNYPVEANVTLRAPAKLQALFPHMHLRGKSFEYSAIYPTGETQVLLKVPNYDFNWQLTYYLDKPLELPAGTRFHATAHYDNSANNKYNPDPAKDVYWGDQSWEEMFAGFVDLAIPVDMKPVTLVKPAAPAAPAPSASAAGGN